MAEASSVHVIGSAPALLSPRLRSAGSERGGLPQLRAERQHRLLAPSSAGGKSGWAPLGSMSKSCKLSVKTWQGRALSGSSGGNPASGPIRGLVSSVPVVSGLRAWVLADCWPGLISGHVDLSVVLAPALHFPTPLLSLTQIGEKLSAFMGAPVVMLGPPVLSPPSQGQQCHTISLQEG